MNRELKFRAWYDGDGKKGMYFPTTYSYSKVFGVKKMQWLFPCDDGHHKYIVTPLMQFTGLKDKKGKEIYEGDIVSIEYGKGVVEYSEKQAMFIINWIGDNEAYNESLAYNPINYIYGKTRKDIEVIGNIYENPELLK